MFEVVKEIRSLLLESEDIRAYVSDKVFPLVAPENTEGDFIIYQRDGFKQEYTKFGVSEQSPVVNVVIVCEDYPRSNVLASLVYETLSGDFTEPDMHIELEDSTEDFIDNKYIQVLKFSIKNL